MRENYKSGGGIKNWSQTCYQQWKTVWLYYQVAGDN